MTYDEIKTIFSKYSFITEEITKDNRVIYVRAPETNFDMTVDWRNIIATAEFEWGKPILCEIYFYSAFYLTKNGICTTDTIQVKWADEKITEAKLERKCKNLVKRIKFLSEKYKLDRITRDF